MRLFPEISVFFQINVRSLECWISVPTGIISSGFMELNIKDIDDVVFCPFCYNQTSADEEKCAACGKNIPQIIYYHGDDDTWIASGV